MNYDRLVTTLQRSDKDDLPLLSDFEIDPPDLQVISEPADNSEKRALMIKVIYPLMEISWWPG